VTPQVCALDAKGDKFDEGYDIWRWIVVVLLLLEDEDEGERKEEVAKKEEFLSYKFGFKK
jgi:hypothetical protein